MKTRQGLALRMAVLLVAGIASTRGAGASVREHGEAPYTYYNADVPDLMFGRDREMDLVHQAVDLRVDVDARTIEGSTILVFTPVVSTDRVHVQAGEMTVTGAALGPGRAAPLLGSGTAPVPGSTTSWVADEDTLTVLLGRTVEPGDTLALTLDYRAAPRKGLYFRGPIPGSPNRHPSVFSQGETESNHFWFPCRDYPDDRATSEVRITVASPYTAVSNGTLESLHENGDATRSFHWLERVPHTVYLTSLAVGVYEETALPPAADPVSRVPLAAYGWPGDRDRVLASLTETGEIIACFERLTGQPYPYERYAQVFVTRFLHSGMENVGATTLTDWTLHADKDEPDFDSIPLVAHEAAHQWFGDWITCRNWSHVWLNEGFASYMALLYAECAGDRDDFERRIVGTLDSYLDGAKTFRRPLIVHNYRPGEAPFDAPHAYNKGALVLHLLRDVLGDDAFFNGVRAYVRDHRGGVVETADFRRTMEEATGRDLGLFFHQWVESPGHPELEVSSRWDEDTHLVTVKVKQAQADDGETPVFAFPLDIMVVAPGDSLDANGTRHGTTHRFEVRDREEAFHLPAAERPRMVIVDPDARVLGSIRLDVEARYLRRMLREAPTVAARGRAARELARVGPGPEDTDSLAAAARRDGSWWVRREAVRALAKTPGESATAAVVAALSDNDSRVRQAVCQALVEQASDEAARALLAHARSERSESVRGEAAAALGAVVHDRAFAVAGSEKPAVSTDAARGVLNDLLSVPSHHDVVRAGALRGLVALRDPHAVDTAIRSTGETRGDFERLAAVAALGSAGGALGEEESPAVRERAYARLTALLDDPFFRIRLGAIEALGDLGDERATALIERAATREWEGGATGPSRTALRKIGERSGNQTVEVTKLRESLRKLEDKQTELERRLDALGKRIPAQDSP